MQSDNGWLTFGIWRSLMEGEDQKSNINSMDVKKPHKPLVHNFHLQKLFRKKKRENDTVQPLPQCVCSGKRPDTGRVFYYQFDVLWKYKKHMSYIRLNFGALLRVCLTPCSFQRIYTINTVLFITNNGPVF